MSSPGTFPRPPKSVFLTRLFLLAAGAWWMAVPGAAGDWPQILGPNRDGRAAGERLPARWPAAGPALAWRYDIGSGFAGPAVVGDELFVFHRVGDAERLEKLDARTGRPLWQVNFPARYRGSFNPDSGPRCVPLVHGDHVYLFGASGDLHCVARADGAKRWSRATHREFNATAGYFGAGSTPIAIGQVLLVNIGGRPDAGIVAFSLDTGETVWQKTAERASYSSPVQTTLDGKPHVVFVARYHALAVAPDTGEIRFRFPFGQRGPTVNAAMPLLFEGQLFVSSAYGAGCRLVRIDGPQITTLWSSDKVLSSHYNTPVLYREHLYGIHGREDLGLAELRCVAVADGTVKWRAPDFGAAHLLLADDKLLLLKVDGTLLLIQPNERQCTVLSEARVSDNIIRALPALSRGRLFLRDNAGDTGSLLCLTVGR